MPYISKDRRELLESALSELKLAICGLRAAPTPGDMNYVITELLTGYAKDKAMSDGLLPYKVINEVVGILECAKLEFYRRAAAPKEDQAIKDNGDIPRYILNLPVDGG